MLMGLQIANTAGYTKRSFTSSGIFMGYCLGNFTGPLLFKEKDAPKYIPGWRATFGTTVAALTLAIVYRYYCLWENKRRDRGGVMEAFDHAFEDDLTDKKVCFMILLSFEDGVLTAMLESAIPLYDLISVCSISAPARTSRWMLWNRVNKRLGRFRGSMAISQTARTFGRLS